MRRLLGIHEDRLCKNCLHWEPIDTPCGGCQQLGHTTTTGACLVTDGILTASFYTCKQHEAKHCLFTPAPEMTDDQKWEHRVEPYGLVKPCCKGDS